MYKDNAGSCYTYKSKEAEFVFGSTDDTHPGVDYLLNDSNPVYVGGKLECIDLPHHYDYQHLRHTPESLKHKIREMGWDNIVAFQTRNPLHRAHVEMTLNAIKELKPDKKISFLLICDFYLKKLLGLIF